MFRYGCSIDLLLWIHVKSMYMSYSKLITYDTVTHTQSFLCCEINKGTLDERCVRPFTEESLLIFLYKGRCEETMNTPLLHEIPVVSFCWQSPSSCYKVKQVGDLFFPLLCLALFSDSKHFQDSNPQDVGPPLYRSPHIVLLSSVVRKPEVGLGFSHA